MIDSDAVLSGNVFNDTIISDTVLSNTTLSGIIMRDIIMRGIVTNGIVINGIVISGINAVDKIKLAIYKHIHFPSIISRRISTYAKADAAGPGLLLLPRTE
ncbi:hypothetical protein UCREL1_3596 [Eutypa lata UCREL1]|uniref:Uncharacterized protein n=1 Tax=Eutypa lata (strain UCR-EL1) TaxID=1287681 RepID=M7THE3_EUTLA|nr:hypothetical protein UCREL1_3596 [Eutypa lata UCREL1]